METSFAPVAMRTASWSEPRSYRLMSLPTLTSVLMWTPIPTIRDASYCRTSFGRW